MKKMFVSIAVFFTVISLNAQDVIVQVNKPEVNEEALKNKLLNFWADEIYNNINAQITHTEKEAESKVTAYSEDAARLDSNQLTLMNTTLSFYDSNYSSKNKDAQAPKIKRAKGDNDYKLKMQGGSCERKFYKIQAIQAEGIKLYNSARELGIKADMRRGKEKCDLFKQSLNLLDKSATKFKKAEKKVVGGIVACDTTNAKSIIDMGEECRNSLKTIDELRAAIKKEMAIGCR